MAERRLFEAPVLRTRRLVLRPHGLADFEAVAAIWSDPETVRYITEPLDQDTVWARLQRTAGAWPLIGFGSWAVEEVAGGRLIGEIGFLQRHRHGVERLEPECGWVLVSAAQGRGYATEALAAVLAWGDERFERTTCIISPENLPSLKLARRHGFRDLGPAGPEAGALLRFERPRLGRSG